jgi:hypothetical protein
MRRSFFISLHYQNKKKMSKSKEENNINIVIKKIKHILKRKGSFDLKTLEDKKSMEYQVLKGETFTDILSAFYQLSVKGEINLKGKKF